LWVGDAKTVCAKKLYFGKNGYKFAKSNSAERNFTSQKWLYNYGKIFKLCKNLLIVISYGLEENETLRAVVLKTYYCAARIYQTRTSSSNIPMEMFFGATYLRRLHLEICCGRCTLALKIYTLSVL